MARICRWVLLGYLVLWAVATALFIIGTFGLLGQEQDPLSGVFLLPLGAPWVFWTGELPDAFRPFAAVVAPLVNIAILGLLCRAQSRRRS